MRLWKRCENVIVIFPTNTLNIHILLPKVFFSLNAFIAFSLLTLLLLLEINISIKADQPSDGSQDANARMSPASDDIGQILNCNPARPPGRPNSEIFSQIITANTPDDSAVWNSAQSSD